MLKCETIKAQPLIDRTSMQSHIFDTAPVGKVAGRRLSQTSTPITDVPYGGVGTGYDTLCADPIVTTGSGTDPVRVGIASCGTFARNAANSARA